MTIASSSPKNFTQGTRVDCLYNGDYFRGTVDVVTVDGERDLCRVCFDDGDVRDDVPQEDMELPLEPRMRVESLFEDEGAYFDGVIGRDNGDATYRVEFDDGDVLGATARRDIRIASSPTNHEGAGGDTDQRRGKTAVGDADQGERIPIDDLQHIYDGHEGQSKSTTEDNIMDSGNFPAQDLSPSYSQEWTDDENGAVDSGVKASSGDNHVMPTMPDKRHRDIDNTITEGGSETFHDKDWADCMASARSSGRFTCGSSGLDNRAKVSPVSHSRGSSSSSRERNNERGQTEGGSFSRLDLFIEPSHQSRRFSSEEAIPARGEGIDVPEVNHGRTEKRGDQTEDTIGDHCGEGKRRVRNVRAMKRSPAFKPMAPNPVHAHIEALASAAPQLMEDAPPDFRLLAVSYQMAAFLDQLRNQEAEGETWSIPSFSTENTMKRNVRSHAKQFDTGHDDTAKTLPEKASGATPWGAKTHTLKAGVVAPTFPVHLGLRKVVENLSKLRMRQVALARLCYGNTSREMVQALCDLAEDYAREGLWLQPDLHFTHILAIVFPYVGMGHRSAVCARLILQVLGILRTASADSNSGQVSRENVEALISAHPNQSLRSAGPEIFGEDFPTTCDWGSAVGYLREYSGLFIDLNLKVLEGVLPKHAGEVRVAIQRVDPEGMGIADIQDFLSAVRAVSSVGGFCLDANYPGLESSLKDLIGNGSMSDGSGRESSPITWEEVLALMVEAEDTHYDGKDGGKRENQRRLLGVRIRLLTGRLCQTHTNNLPAACNHLSSALSELQRLGLGEALSCIPVLYALADALVLSHRRHSEKLTIRAKTLAHEWIQGKEGQEVCKQESKRLLEECRRRLEVIPRAEVEQRTLQALVAYRANFIAKELEEDNRELETAEEHLVRGWEILESVYGRDHVEVGASCISLGNLAIIRHRLDEAENWFRRALGTFERCFSEECTPVTASTAVALGNVLIRRQSGTGQDGDDQPAMNHSRQRSLLEASALLEKAARFYSGRVEAALRANGGAGGENSPGREGNYFPWSDPDVAGSRLDPQTRNFAGRAADLWIHAVELRECVHDPAGRAAGGNGCMMDNEDDCCASRGIAGLLATMLEQAARATEISKGPCSIALAKSFLKLGEVRQEDGDYAGARDAFFRAHVVYTNRYGRQHPRSKSAAAAATIAANAVAAASSAAR